MKTVLFNGEVLNSQAFRELLGKEAEKHLLHIPLERTRYHTFEEEEKLIAGSLNEYTFTIYGGLKNAHYFLKYVEQQHLEKQVLNQIHLVTDHPTRRFLEENGIPAILPRERVKGIDILEFLLRISTQGDVLYPTTDQHTEEIPGLLNELKRSEERRVGKECRERWTREHGKKTREGSTVEVRRRSTRR